MAINARDRFARLPKVRQEKILARAAELIAEEMSLAELREIRLRSQAQLAEKLGIKQAAVSRLERRADMYLSTLRNLIDSMGGTLRIIAQFPDRPPVCINQFQALDQAVEEDSSEIPVENLALSTKGRAKKLHFSDELLGHGSGKKSKRSVRLPARPAAKRGKKR
jgi:transcriptional regulator with XRE-family HTH domain